MEEYFLQSTRDGSDRSAEIEEKLTLYGVCILGSGVFYVTGVKMPDHSVGRGVEISIYGGSAMMTSCFFGIPETVNPIRLSGGAKLRLRDCIDSVGNDCTVVEKSDLI